MVSLGKHLRSRGVSACGVEGSRGSGESGGSGGSGGRAHEAGAARSPETSAGGQGRSGGLAMRIGGVTRNASNTPPFETNMRVSGVSRGEGAREEKTRTGGSIGFDSATPPTATSLERDVRDRDGGAQADTGKDTGTGTRPSANSPANAPVNASASHDEIRKKLTIVLGDKTKFLRSARASFTQFDADKSDTLSFAECRALIDRLILNLSLPPLDEHKAARKKDAHDVSLPDTTLHAIFERFNTSDGNEMNAQDFSQMFWQILWRVRERYYPTKSLQVRRAFFVSRVALAEGQIKKIFTFERKLGSGSFGEVHLVLEKSSKMQRCCKIIDKDKAAVPVEQIEAEIQVLKTLDHPNVIKIFEVYEDYNNLYIIQEVCAGGEILQRIADAISRGKVLTEKYAQELMHQLIGALAYIHEQNIVHKDLKPENVMYQTTDLHSDIKVIDFGLAEIFSKHDDISSNAAGTVLYMAPEVFARKVTTKCDMWSAGGIMFLLLTGHLPFNGRSVAEVKDKITHVEPAYEHYCKHVSAEGVDLLKKLLDKSYKKRWSAKQALKHPWIEARRSHLPQTALDPALCSNLRRYTKHTGLKPALINLMTHQLNLNSAQIKRISDTFKQMDRDCSGVLSRAELNSELSKAGMEPWEINKIVQSLDIDGSGAVSYTEFLAAAYTWRESELNVVWTAFNKMDRDQDGKISLEEFAEMLTGGKDTLLDHAAETRQVLAKIDRNGDGYVDWEEFLAYMRSI